MIPEAAVEAAAREVFERHGRKYYSGIGPWEDLDHKFRTAWLEDARLALEAAAPHMLAEAWDEGAIAQAAAYGMDKDTGPNPYSSQA